MNKSQKAVSVFNELANLYQQKYMSVDLYADTLDFFCDQFDNSKISILDIACGPGNISKYLLQKRPDFKLLGIDLAPNMITLAKQNNPEAKFKVMDCMHIPDLDQKFDGIMCGFCLPYLAKEQTELLITNISNCLSSDGLLYISTMEDAYSNSGFTKGSTGDEIYMHYYEENDLVEILEKNHFKILKVERKITRNLSDVITTDLIIIANKSEK